MDSARSDVDPQSKEDNSVTDSEADVSVPIPSSDTSERHIMIGITDSPNGTIDSPSGTTDSPNGSEVKKLHPLKLYISSPDIKTMKSSKILEVLKKWTAVPFVIDKIARRTYAFLHFNNPNEVLQFLHDVDGKIIRNVPLQVSQCELRQEQDPRISGWHKQPKSLQEEQPYPPHVGPFPPRDFSSLPYLADLKQKRVGHCDHVTITERVTPLIRYSYHAQLEMKFQFIKTCVKNFTRKMFTVIYQSIDTKLTRSQAKRRRLNPINPIGITDDTPRIESTQDKDNKKLLWCHPEMAKGFIGCSVDPTIPSPSTACLGYRNKCEFTIGFNSSESKIPEVGFVRKVVNNEPIISSCFGALHVPYSMQEICFRLRQIVTENLEKFPIYSRTSQKGIWRIVMVRSSTVEKALMIVVQIKTLSFVAKILNSQSDNRTEEEIRTSIYHLLINSLVYSDGKKLRLYDGMTIHSLYIQERAENSDAFHNKDFNLIYGTPYLTQHLLGLQFRIHPAAFFQTNSETCTTLYQKVFEILKIGSEKIVLDICSGTGTIALSLYTQIAKASALSNREPPRFIGIEIVAEAVESANENARLNGIPNNVIEFMVGKAESVLPSLLSNLPNNVEISAIVDPPRAGLHPTVCRSLVDCHQIDHLVYISCNPETLVEDVVRLCTPTLSSPRPFKPINAIGVDMFPHTFHIEMILDLRRTSDSDFGLIKERIPNNIPTVM